MKCKVQIKEVKKLDEIPGYWNEEDYRALLDAYDFPDANKVDSSEVLELLLMAMTDFDPPEAAKVVLKYKLGDQLSDGQIQAISHEMLEDKVAEEYPDISVHYDLYNINQLLLKAFNGKFPDTDATRLSFELFFSPRRPPVLTPSLVLKILQPGWSSRNIIKRLFEDQLAATRDFLEAEHIIWKMSEPSPGVFELITSDYWLNKEDFETLEYESFPQVEDD